MKKILVSGCANCPYLRVFDDGAGNGYDSIVHGECTHPSFKIRTELPGAMVTPTEFLAYGSGAECNKITNVKPQGTPPWCPLPEEIQIYTPTNCCI